jgi:5-methylcytosine-specific restriction endonuclease McrA
MQTVLVLNANYTLLEVVSWQRAVSMLVRDKVRTVERYADCFLRSPSVTLPFPAVVARTSYVCTRRRVRLSRRNLIARDSYTCQYCGTKPRRPNGRPDMEHLTLDHVVPRSRAVDGWVVLPWSGRRVRVSSWENLITACSPCNSAKANRTPRQAGLTMRAVPAPPSFHRLAWMAMLRHDIPAEWLDYLPVKPARMAS